LKLLSNYNIPFFNKAVITRNKNNEENNKILNSKYMF